MDHVTNTPRLSICSLYPSDLDSPIIQRLRQNSIQGSQVPIISSSSSLSDNHSEIINDNNNIYKTSKRRWSVLFAITVFGITSGLVDTTSTILHTMLDLLEWPLDKYVFLGLIFTHLPLLTTIPSAWFIDKYGIKITLYVATVFMLIRNGSRALLFNPTLPHWQEFKHIYWIISHIFGMQVLVTFYCTPLKISETWFSSSERSIAWTIIVSSASIGSGVASFTYPRIIHRVRDVVPLFWINVICAIITAIVIFTCVTKTKPKFSPSERMSKAAENEQNISYFVTIKRIVKHKDMMIHIIQEAIFDGATISVLAVKQDILIASGHSEIFVGNLASIDTIVGLVVLISLSPFVHKVKDIKFVCKLGVLARTILFVIHLVSLLYPMDEYIVMLTAITYVICKSWVTPNMNNMTAQLACGNVSVATASCFSMFIIIFTITSSQVVFMKLVKTSYGKPDYTDAMIFATALSTISSAAYILFFQARPAKHVVEMETAAVASANGGVSNQASE